MFSAAVSEDFAVTKAALDNEGGLGIPGTLLRQLASPDRQLVTQQLQKSELAGDQNPASNCLVFWSCEVVPLISPLGKVHGLSLLE